MHLFARITHHSPASQLPIQLFRARLALGVPGTQQLPLLALSPDSDVAHAAWISFAPESSVSRPALAPTYAELAVDQSVVLCVACPVRVCLSYVMAAALAVHGWLAPSPSTRSTARVFRRAETVGGRTAALPCRGSRRCLSRLVAAASSGHAGTATGTADSAATVLDYRLAGGDGGGYIAPTIESTVESVIFDFRFLALLAIAGSLAGSLLCFLSGCVYIKEAFHVYWTSCVRGVHTGQMVLRLVEAIDVYLAGTVMLIFGMGLYGLFISNDSPDVPSSDHALKRSSLFGMFTLKERPRWMKISSLDELKTKLGHIIVMILLVKMFERSKMVHIGTGMDLLSYAVCIFLSSASLYILHNLHRPGHE